MPNNRKPLNIIWSLSGCWYCRPPFTPGYHISFNVCKLKGILIYFFHYNTMNRWFCLSEHILKDCLLWQLNWTKLNTQTAPLLTGTRSTIRQITFDVVLWSSSVRKWWHEPLSQLPSIKWMLFSVARNLNPPTERNQLLLPLFLPAYFHITLQDSFGDKMEAG